jgi:predicted transcriptional regulator
MPRLINKPNFKAPWTEEHYATLAEMVIAGRTIPEIAKAMGRSQESVRNKIWQRGLTQRTRKRAVKILVDPAS